MKTIGRDVGLVMLFSLTFCSLPIVASAANSGESIYVYEGIDSAAKLIQDAERSSEPSLTVAIDRGHDDSDQHARDAKLNLVIIDGIPAMAYSLKYYAGAGYLPALVITCRGNGLLELSQVLWTSDEIDHRQFQPYVVEYQGYGLDELFKLRSEVESVVDFRGTAIRFRGTIQTDDPGIRKLGSTTNLQAYIRFAGLRFSADNSHHASTLGSLIDHCGGEAVDSPARSIEANTPPIEPDTSERIANRRTSEVNDAKMPPISSFRKPENVRASLRADKIAAIEKSLSELAVREGRVYRGLWFWSQFRDPRSMRAVFRGNRTVPFTAEEGAIYFHAGYPLERGHSDQMGILTAWVRVYAAMCGHLLPKPADELHIKTFTTSGPIISRRTYLSNTDVLRFQNGLMEPYEKSRKAFENNQQAAFQNNQWAKALEIMSGGRGAVSNLAKSQVGPYIYALDDFSRFIDAVGCDSPTAQQMSLGISEVAHGRSLPAETTNAAIPGAEWVSEKPQKAGEFRLHSEICWDYDITNHNPCGCLLDIAKQQLGEKEVIPASIDYLDVHKAFMQAPAKDQQLCHDPLGAISAGLL